MGQDVGEYRQPRNYNLAFAAVVICGTLNNFAYCIISGASQDLAKQFRAEDQTTVLTTVMNISALLATALSTSLLVCFRFYTRVVLVLVMSSVAYGGVAFAASLEHGFWVAAAFSCIGGMAQIFGEVTNLAFLKSFPPQLVGGWGAGTGLAGIFGSLSYILLRGLQLSNSVVFLLCTPLGLIYWIAFHYLHKEATRGVEGQRLARALGGIRRATVAAPLQGDTVGHASGEEWEQVGPREPLHEIGEPASLPATCSNIQAAMKASGSIMFNLVAVYCLEYTIYPGLDDRETICASKAWYTTMWMSYNVGVTMSRFSVTLFRIKRVWLLTAFQLVNVVGWFVEVYTGAIRNLLPNQHGYYIMAAWMVLVGLCGGATYGNCMYLFNTQVGIPEGLRELGVNLGFLMSNVGITLATLSFTLFDQTILKKSILYPHDCPPT